MFDVPALAPGDQEFLDDFGAALARFRDMSLEEFRAEFGPDKEYRRGPEFVRGDANGDFSVEVSDAVCILFYLFVGKGACRNPTCKDRLDVDDSGALDISDTMNLLCPRRPFLGFGSRRCRRTKIRFSKRCFLRR